MQNQKVKTVYRSDTNEVLKFAAELNSGGIVRNKMTAAIELIRRCVFALEGVERRKLNDSEVTELISKGYSLTD